MAIILLASLVSLAAFIPQAVPVQAPHAGSHAASDGAMRVEEENDLLKLTYGWPAAAGRIEALKAELRADLQETRASVRETAADSRKLAQDEGDTFHKHSYSKLWEAMGETDRLLSIAAKVEVYSGGAHGNSFFNTILWDKKAGKPLLLFDLFTNKAQASAVIGARYCPGLDEARAERRGEALPLPGKGWLVECPALENYEITPVDANGDGRFETLRILLPPGEAGSNAEGGYEVDVTTAGDLNSLIKPEYRASF